VRQEDKIKINPSPGGDTFYSVRVRDSAMTNSGG
jgi:hypothetical protein